MKHTTEALQAVVGLIFVACFFALFIWGFKSARIDAEIAVTSAGHTDVSIGRWAWFACSKGDTYSWHFTAKNVQGNPISGVACCGILKSCTVRY